MYFSTIAATAVVSFVAFGSAQSIDPNSVPLSLRTAWCTSQIASCPLICTQETDGSAAVYANDCDAATLQYDCICDNGLAPNISEYSQTIPYYTCTQSNTDCQTNCGQDSTCAAACIADHPCGAQNPTRVNTTSSSATMTATGTGASGSATGSQVYTGFGSAATGSSDSSSSSSNSNSGSSAASRVIVNMGQIYGLGVVATGIFAGFTLLL